MFVTYEDLCSKNLPLWLVDPKTDPLIKQASEDERARFVFVRENTHQPYIFVKCDDIDAQVVGFLIRHCGSRDINGVYVGVVSYGELSPGDFVCNFSPEEDIDTILARARYEVDKCPICYRRMPYSSLKHNSAGYRMCQMCSNIETEDLEETLRNILESEK